MKQHFFRIIVLLGAAFFLGVLQPIASFAATEDALSLANLESLWATDYQDNAFTGQRDRNERVTVASFQASTLGAHELFLDTYVGQKTSLVFAVTKNTCRVLELPGEVELKPVLTRFHALASSVESSPDSLRLATDAMALLMFGELQDLLANCNHLIFSAHGVFNLLPLNLLLPHDRAIELSRVPSAITLKHLRKVHSTRKPMNRVRTLAVGAPPELEQANSPAANREYADLDSTYKGVTLIQPNGNGSLPELELLGSFDLIHVAAQSVGDDRHPLQSAIQLHPTNPAMEIKTTDLTGLQLDTQMVVLANCSSASGQDLSGEGIQSLASAFLSTGVPTVITALWPVENDATNFFMTAFYESLSAGNHAGGALQSARQKCQNDPAFSVPSHWGGFVLTGDSEMTIPLEQKPNLNVGRILAILLGVLVGVLFLLRQANKKRVS